MVCGLTGCRETIQQLLAGDIEAGDEISFSAEMQMRGLTRAASTEALSEGYTFTIGMYKQDGTQEGTDGTYTVGEEGGELKAVKPLYWHSTTVRYGFRAHAGSETLNTDQSTKTQWLQQDRLEGGSGETYYNAKEWKGLYSDKVIPLTMNHKRALITIILKAGEGVSAKALRYSAAQRDITTHIYSYTDGANGVEQLAINPLATGIWNDEDSTTRYDAIVEPHDYRSNAESELITKISLSGQNYSFSATNDAAYKTSPERYNLQAGQHLTITVTLGRNSREVYMTAYIEDWTEDVYTTICDDYGNAGDPIYITTRDELYNFLADEKQNKPGNVAMVVNDITLTSWASTSDLKSTLNLGGWTLTGSERFLKSIASTGNLQNGTVKIAGTVDAAIADTNGGTIEDVKVEAADQDAHATVAGLVKNNGGVIVKCQSALAVNGADGTLYVGGIAAQSLSSTEKQALIDGCLVTNSVKGGNAGGGIVGLANGSVINNTFEYGITLSQNPATHKNIVGAAQGSLSADGNAWPTVATDLSMTNVTADRYTGIIDSNAELLLSASSEHNAAGNRYRLAKDISLTDTIPGEIKYDLDGNGKQIATSARIFYTISGSVHDLKVHVNKSLIAKNINGDKDHMAPLAYAVAGSQAELRDIQVTMAPDTYIQASNPAGLVVWAAGGAKVSRCEVTADIRAWVSHPDEVSNELKYAGGIVSTASLATISQCEFHSSSYLTLSPDITSAKIIYYGGIVGGVSSWSGEAPQVTITDCTSFCSSYITDPEDAYHGGILGYAMLEKGENATKDCQGNWWPNNKDGKPAKGVAAYQGGSQDAVIGKRNGVTPRE